MSSNQQDNDSGCISDDDPSLVLKINKGLSMGYDYEFIKSVLEQQNQGDDMSKFIETMVRTAEINHQIGTTPSPIISSNEHDIHTENINVPLHDVYILDGADIAFSYGTPYFSWQNIENCLKYFHCHGHKKVYVILPFTLKHHRHEQKFSESKILRDLERKNLLIYTNRSSKQTNKSNSYVHINEMLKFTQKNYGYLVTNVSLKDILFDFTIYKQILEEKIIRYRLENEHFQPLLVSICIDQDGNDCETYYPLCPYGKKCTYGFKCKYFHIERRQENARRFQYSQAMTRGYFPVSSPTTSSYESSLASPSTSSFMHPFQQIKTNNNFSFQSTLSVNSQENLANRIQSVRHLWDEENS